MNNDNLNPAPAERDIWTISRLNLEVQGLLESTFPLLWIEAEISNLSRPASGHLYFSLKDDRAQVSAAMFRGRNQRLRFEPKNGLQVLVRARVTLYPPRGGFQLVVEHMEEAGEGRLRREFEQLKTTLQEEGLFAADRKQALPTHPRQIGLITSASGAALKDILNVLRRRSPQLSVLIFPTPVQGKEAPAQIRAALAAAIQRQDCDVLVMTRGGGSLEDLWAFNDEALARDVAACPIPIVSAIGHEIDFALTDFVADVRAPTPSAAAELISPDSSALDNQRSALKRRLDNAMERQLSQLQERTRGLSKRLQSPQRKLERYSQQLDELNGRLTRHLNMQMSSTAQQLTGLQKRLSASDPRQLIRLAQERLLGLQKRLALPLPRTSKHTQMRLAQLAQRLHVASPLATLERGFSITLTEDDNAIRSIDDVRNGASVKTRLKDGTLHSTVTRIE
jgi:exodeoxyribonuclease VII large subunit